MRNEKTYTQKITYTNNCLFYTCYDNACSNINVKRSAKLKPTTESRKRKNRKRAVEDAIAIAENNFNKEDSRFVLITYNRSKLPADKLTVRKDASELIDKIRRKFGNNVKILLTIHKGSEKGRYHFHVLINRKDIEDIRTIKELWGKGWVGSKIISTDYVYPMVFYMANNAIKFPNKSIFIRTRNFDKPQTIVVNAAEDFKQSIDIIKEIEAKDYKKEAFVYSCESEMMNYHSAIIPKTLCDREILNKMLDVGFSHNI